MTNWMLGVELCAYRTCRQQCMMYRSEVTSIDGDRYNIQVRDLSLDTPSPTIGVRSGKGGKTRLVPVHSELHGALGSALAYGDISQGRIVEAHPATAWRWVQAAVKRGEELGAIAPGRRVGTHAAPQLCPAPADERHPDQLPITVVGTLVDSDGTHLPGACAGPNGQPGGGTVIEARTRGGNASSHIVCDCRAQCST